MSSRQTQEFLSIFGMAAIGSAGCLMITLTMAQSQSAQQGAEVKISAREIGGLVSSSNGPEAGVWVIAETTDLPTRYIKEVVTDSGAGCGNRRAILSGQLLVCPAEGARAERISRHGARRKRHFAEDRQPGP